METKKLVSVSGQGYLPSDQKVGMYEVKFKDGSVWKFYELNEAIKFYESFEEEMALWDVTGVPELLDAKQFIH